MLVVPGSHAYSLIRIYLSLAVYVHEEMRLIQVLQ